MKPLPSIQVKHRWMMGFFLLMLLAVSGGSIDRSFVLYAILGALLPFQVWRRREGDSSQIPLPLALVPTFTVLLFFIAEAVITARYRGLIVSLGAVLLAWLVWFFARSRSRAGAQTANPI